MNKSFLQSKGWAAFQTSLGHSTKEINGTQVIFHSIPLLNKTYAYIPYGNGAPETLEEIKKQGVMFIRMEPTTPFDTNGWNKSQNIQPSKTLVLDLNKSEAELLAAMHPKTRYNIGLAKKHEVEILEASSTETNEALQLICDTAKRQGYKSQDLDYYQSLITFFAANNIEDSPKAKTIVAKYNNVLVAAGLYIEYLDTITYLFGGTSSENKNVMAPHLMHWKTICDAKNQGFKVYDFWGIETAKGDTPGFVRFKLGFGGTTVEYPGAYDLILEPLWYTIYKVLRKINQLLH